MNNCVIPHSMRATRATYTFSQSESESKVVKSGLQLDLFMRVRDLNGVDG